MNIGKLSIKNIFHKPLYSLLSLISLAISIGLLIGIRQMDTSIRRHFENSTGKIDMIIGAKGSPLQLVLSSALHIDNPTGNIPYRQAKKIAKNPLIKSAVPISYGDNYKGYRIVGTTQGFAPLYNAELQKGRSVQKPMEVVLGHSVAEKLKLSIGDTFLSSHGLVEEGAHQHSEPLTVVGIYKPAYKVIDRLIITALESIWEVHHHGHHDNEHDKHEGHEEDGHKEITSMLVSFRSPSAFLTLPRQINENTNMQAVLPKYEMERLFQYTGVGVQAITWLAYTVLVISCITIFISLFKMVKERAFDLALLRTYGASNLQLVKIVAYEGFLIGLIAWMVGVLLSQMGMYYVFEILQENFKQIDIQKFPWQEALQIGVLVLFMIMLSITMAIPPILKMNISNILSNEK
ncbi:ABC transporter permease [Galbibacter sp. PAP.153]|uniref:ABC transporter permease n=1 Tax=Galbibacter sp. PAP.153 TaxID=3104623 RepID=UPI0030080728